MEILILALLASLALIFCRAIFRERKLSDERFGTPFENLDHKELLNQLSDRAGEHNQMQFDRANSEIKEVVDKCRKMVIDGLDKIFDKIVLIDGGALTLSTTLFLSEEFKNFELKIFLGIAFIFFSISLICILFHLFFRITSASNILFANNETGKFKESFEPGPWTKFKNHMRKSRYDEVYGSLFLEIAISSLIAGVFSLVLLGIFNINKYL